jgi:hypothetical protein
VNGAIIKKPDAPKIDYPDAPPEFHVAIGGVFIRNPEDCPRAQFLRYCHTSEQHGRQHQAEHKAPVFCIFVISFPSRF